MIERHLLKTGSLLYMTPEMQKEWKHGLLQEDTTAGRISLTYRCMRTG